MKKSLQIAILLLMPQLVLAHLAENAQNLGPGPMPGFPMSGEGIKVVPLAKMNIPEEMKQEIKQKALQQKTKGYIESSSTWPKQLMYMGNGGETKIDGTGVNPHDTNMKKNLSQIKLAFPFKGVPALEATDVIGYAVTGMWSNGWTGIGEYFNAKGIGTCKYTLNHFPSSDGAAYVSSEIVRYDVNKKPTTLSIEGSKNTGFLYTVRWADNLYKYDLECANDELDPNINKEVIKLAQSIDTYTNK